MHWIYEGEFVEDERHGNGVLIDKDQGFKYWGEFSHGEMTGQGILRKDSGEEYQGDLLNGIKEGIGLESNRDEDY